MGDWVREVRDEEVQIDTHTTVTGTKTTARGAQSIIPQRLCKVPGGYWKYEEENTLEIT